MPVPPANEVAANWAQGLQNASGKMARGVARVTQAPGQLAANATDLWATKVAASKDKYRSNVGRVSLGEWQTAMTQKGISRAVEGAQQAQGKFEQRIAPVLQHVESVAGQVRAMPKGTTEQGIARAAAFIRGMAQYRSAGRA